MWDPISNRKLLQHPCLGLMADLCRECTLLLFGVKSYETATSISAGKGSQTTAPERQENWLSAVGVFAHRHLCDSLGKVLFLNP